MSQCRVKLSHHGRCRHGTQRCIADHDGPAAPRRMVLVALDDQRELAELAELAIRLHDSAADHNECDSCQLVEKWRGRIATTRAAVDMQTRRAMRRAATVEDSP